MLFNSSMQPHSSILHFHPRLLHFTSQEHQTDTTFRPRRLKPDLRKKTQCVFVKLAFCHYCFRFSSYLQSSPAKTITSHHPHSSIPRAGEIQHDVPLCSRYKRADGNEECQSRNHYCFNRASLTDFSGAHQTLDRSPMDSK
jgi:hypothetical protein